MSASYLSNWGFLNPQAFWGIPIMLLIFMLLRRFEIDLRALHQTIGRSLTISTRVRVLAPLILLSLGLLALARPYIGQQTLTVEGRGRDLFLLIDVSLSMLAQDASPSRMEFARRKAHDIVSFTQQHAAEDRIGIILFAGDAYIYCPLTSDYAVVNTFLQNIGPDLISSRGSSLLKALTVARDALTESDAVTPGIIIIGDGEDLESGADELKARLSEIKAEVLVIGVGALEGVPIPLAQGGFLSSEGEIVTSRLNEQSLQQIFNEEHRRYVRGTILENDFKDFLSVPFSLSQASHNPDAHKREITIHGETGPYLLGFVLVALVLISAIGKLGAILLCLVTVMPFIADAQPNPLNDSPAYQGYQQYQLGDYQGAYDLFSRALKEAPLNQKNLQSFGSAAFKLGKFDQAERAFSQLEELARKQERRFDAAYNLGNSLLAQKKYKLAIDAYTRALALKHDDVHAHQNKTIAEAYLKQEQEQSSSSANEQQKNQSQSNQPQSSGQNSSDSSASGNPESTDPSGSQSSAEGDASAPASESNQQSTQNSQAADENTSQGHSSSEQISPHSEETDTGEQKPSQQHQDLEQLDKTPLAEREASEWLKALPESPLLIQRLNKQERKKPGEQLW